MAYIEKFLGRRVDIPEDRRYYPKPGVWAQEDGRDVRFGLTEPFLVLAGGIKEMDWLVDEDQVVQAGEAVIFAITGKILYIEAPVAGTIVFNPAAKENVGLVLEDSYGSGWLFKITPEANSEVEIKNGSDAGEYIECLRDSEGFRNPDGIKGGVSGICKAVYSGIGGQKLSG